MQLRKLKCPNCGGILDINLDDKEYIFCPYCGEKFFVKDEELQNTCTANNTDNSVSAKSKPDDKSKSRFHKFWNKLSAFGRLSAVSIALAAALCAVAFLTGRIFAGIIALVWIAIVGVSLLMKKNVIRVSKSWIPLVTVILSFLLIAPYLSLFKVNIADYRKYNWNEIVLADMLPMPQSPYGETVSNSDSYLTINVNKVTQEQYTKYIEDCKVEGFTFDTETADNSFYAYNEQGYKLSLIYYDYSSEMHISLAAGMEFGELSWPDSGLSKILPEPESPVGEVQQDDEKEFSAYIGHTSIDAFNSYVKACEDNGFTVDSDKTDKHFSAKNADGYRLAVDYQGNNIIYVSLDEPEYNVSIEVTCIENLLFSKYDIDVYIDENLEGSIIHGSTETFDLVLTKGTYVLKFVNDEDDDLSGQVEFCIQKDENLKYKISCSMFGIDVDTIVGASMTDEEELDQDVLDWTLDYADAESFEKALNDGVKVKGKTVQFTVNDYKPDSALGINCWAGEHLNFISEEELDVGKGNIIVGRVTEEPTKVLGSWAVFYEILSIGGEKVEDEIIEQPEPEEPSDTQPLVITLTMGEDDFKGMNYQEAETVFREMGFTKFDYRTVATETEAVSDTICYTEITEWFAGDSDFVKGDKFDADATVTFFYYKYEEPVAPSPVFYSSNDYETAKDGNTGVFSYRDKGGSYDIYWIIDFDEGYVYYFTDGNGESFCDRLKIESGTLNDKITITYHDGGDIWSYYLHFKYVNHPETLIMVDQNGFDWEYSTTDLDDALALRATKDIKDY